MTRPTHNLMTILIATVLATVAVADEIVLKPVASVTGEAVTLGDIATLQGDYATSLADVSLGDRRETLQLADIRRTLADHGVNFARISLSGPLTITINKAKAGSAEATSAESAIMQSEAAVLANPEGVVAVGSDAPVVPTLRETITSLILGHLEVGRGDVRLTFDDRDTELLSESTGQHRFEIEPLTGDGVGRVPVTLRRYAGTQLLATHHTIVDVQLRRSAVVVRNRLTRGQVITDRDVEVKDIWLDSLVQEPVSDIAQVIGMRSVGLMRPGAVVHADDIRSQELIKRGQIVTVRCISGSLVVKTVARAMGNGAMGDMIPVRNERTRDTFTIRVTGPQMGTVEIDPTTVAVTEETR